MAKIDIDNVIGLLKRLDQEMLEYRDLLNQISEKAVSCLKYINELQELHISLDEELCSATKMSISRLRETEEFAVAMAEKMIDYNRHLIYACEPVLYGPPFALNAEKKLRD